MPKAKTPSTKTATASETLAEELIAIKKLLVFALMRTGVSQNQIAGALGISQSSVSRMFPNSGAKPAKDQAGS